MRQVHVVDLCTQSFIRRYDNVLSSQCLRLNVTKFINTCVHLCQHNQTATAMINMTKRLKIKSRCILTC